MARGRFDERERELALKFPLRLFVLFAAPWALVVVLFFAMNVGRSTLPGFEVAPPSRSAESRARGWHRRVRRAAVAGNVGAVRRFEYTVIGAPVNEAARLTELAKSAPARVLASAALLERASEADADRWEAGETVNLRGLSQATRVATPRRATAGASTPDGPAPSR